jgi:endogenous inhibitor of DNA gyrase (YacG/DUF329 family)
VSAEQRDCPQCGNPFTWTPAAPRQKYCSPRCKHRWHRAHGKPRKRRRAHQAAIRDVARPPAATTGVGPLSPPTAGTPGQPALAAEPACPHCRKPVALVAWLVPPAAATVKEPPRHADTVRDNQ